MILCRVKRTTVHEVNEFWLIKWGGSPGVRMDFIFFENYVLYCKKLTGNKWKMDKRKKKIKYMTNFNPTKKQNKKFFFFFIFVKYLIIISVRNDLNKSIHQTHNECSIYNYRVLMDGLKKKLRLYISKSI